MGIKQRGLASLSPERRKEIAKMGGRTAHRLGKAHEFTSEEGRKAYRLSRRNILS